MYTVSKGPSKIVHKTRRGMYSNLQSENVHRPSLLDFRMLQVLMLQVNNYCILLMCTEIKGLKIHL